MLGKISYDKMERKTGSVDSLIWIIVAVCWVIDRILKVLVQQQFVPGESIAVIPNIFHLTYVQNSGAAFGMLAGKTWIFIITAVIALGVIIYLNRTMPGNAWLPKIALGMIGSGALGNLYDRMAYGYVIDYADVKIWSYIFNFADSMIVIGVGIILISTLWEERKKKQAGDGMTEQ